jgi:hypothetical protein
MLRRALLLTASVIRPAAGFQGSFKRTSTVLRKAGGGLNGDFADKSSFHTSTVLSKAEGGLDGDVADDKAVRRPPRARSAASLAARARARIPSRRPSRRTRAYPLASARVERRHA